ncbi:MAG: hypothetical protein JW958_05905 [Candidatus Eisenbacteria bacterium]|nr:hypothetical protein [Candidatus Eisenbacteria bacterium]
MPKRYFLILIGIALAFPTGAARAKENNRFLNSEFLPLGARYAGMGGTHVALPGGVACAYTNPAILPWTSDLEFTLEGVFTGGPDHVSGEGDNALTYQERNELGLIGIRFPDRGGFSFAIMEVTRYDHDIRGHLFGLLPEGGTKPVYTKKAEEDPDKLISDYQDRAQIRSFGFTTGYRFTPNASFGLGFWIDRKKVFKKIDYYSSPVSSGEEMDDLIEKDYVDREGNTNDVTLRITGGLYYRLTDRIDGALAFGTGSELQSGLLVDARTTMIYAKDNRTVFDKTPWNMQAGFSFYWSEGLRFAGDVSYQHWKDVHPYLKSTFQFGLGAEWDFDERVTFRGGFRTSFDPTDLPSTDEFPGDAAWREELRDIEWSGTLFPADEYFLTAGVGYRLSPILQIDLGVQNSDLLSAEDGRTMVTVGARFVTEQPDDD